MARVLHKACGRQRRRFVVAIGILAAIGLLVTAGRPAAGGMAKAKTADSFVQSIGIQTHMSTQPFSPYSKQDRIKAALSELGVKHVRDAAQGLNLDALYSRYRDLHSSLGVEYMLNIKPSKSGFETVEPADVDQLVEQMGGSLEAVEGPNEYNSTNADGRNPDWGKELKAFQRDLFGAVNASGASELPVACPPIMRPYPPRDQIPQLGAYCDWANMHSYPHGNHPTGGNPKDSSDFSLLFDNDIPTAKYVGGTAKPITASETGYHTANFDSGISENARAKYAPRLSFEYFNAGIKRGYHYQLIDHLSEGPDDPQSHFGFLHKDFRKKPVFRTMENTIDILEDPGPPFATSSLSYELLDTTPDVHHTLLQKRDGTFYLALWREVRSYDWGTDRPIRVGAREVKVRFPSRMETIKVYEPTEIASSGPADDAEEHPSRTLSSVSSVDVSVDDEVKIIQITKR